MSAPVFLLLERERRIPGRTKSAGHGEKLRNKDLLQSKENALGRSPEGVLHTLKFKPRLKEVPEELVVDLVVILHLGHLNKSAQIARAAVRRSPLQFRIAGLDVGAEQL